MYIITTVLSSQQPFILPQAMRYPAKGHAWFEG